MSEVIVEHSIEVPVSVGAAWRFRTDIATWQDPPAVFALEGPFVDGARGTTSFPDQPSLCWRIRAVNPEHAFDIEMELDGAVLIAEWRFEALANNRTKLTQRLALSGPRASSFRDQLRSGFGQTLADGMQRIARQMVAAGPST